MLACFTFTIFCRLAKIESTTHHQSAKASPIFFWECNLSGTISALAWEWGGRVLERWVTTIWLASLLDPSDLVLSELTVLFAIFRLLGYCLLLFSISVRFWLFWTRLPETILCLPPSYLLDCWPSFTSKTCCIFYVFLLGWSLIGYNLRLIEFLW